MTTAPAVRRYRPEDRAALYDICIRTGHLGGDARDVYPDHDLLPTIFAAPYADFEPDLAFVLDDGTGRAVGYVLGTADTARFVARFRAEWLPRVAARYPAPSGSPATPAPTPTDSMLARLHAPERMLRAELAGYPAHLHIDLLPGWQGRGFGRALMHRFLGALHTKGVPTVHLCMASANTRARAFYDRVGFRELAVADPAPVAYLGRSTVVREKSTVLRGGSTVVRGGSTVVREGPTVVREGPTVVREGSTVVREGSTVVRDADLPGAGVSVVGIGADGWPGLATAAREALRAAQVVFGAARQLALLPAECHAERVPWPSPLRPAVARLLAAHADRRVAVLASGDPMFYGIGRAVLEELRSAGRGAGTLRVLPHVSSVSYACARLGWPAEDVDVVTLVGRPTARLAAALHHGRRLLVLSAGAATPAEIAALLRDRGFGPSPLRVLEQLGGPRERVVGGARERGAGGADGVAASADPGAPAGVASHALDAPASVPTADSWPDPPCDALNIVAVECRRAPGVPRLGAVPGLPDAAYEHDGQLTKRYVRAVTLAALAPAPGELLWDIGGGSGSISIEWLRSHPDCRAVTVERDPVRAARIARNAERLGVPQLHVVTGAAPDALAGLPPAEQVPDAVFIGGGLTAHRLLDTCWAALPAGGRLVANAVTLESEAWLAARHRRHGGELLRLSLGHAAPVGGFTVLRQAIPVTQWSVTKPDDGPAYPHVQDVTDSGKPSHFPEEGRGTRG